ncbi:lysophospholipid acyltransferase family protein [Nocardioides jishulii]|nr:lysophospholipid acyltransferase family protein [Nocardioides jishulii]
MPEAEIIPIGTNGQPGRGTGRTKPSAAARGLARGASRAQGAPRPPAASRGAKPGQPSSAAAGNGTPKPPAQDARREPSAAPTAAASKAPRTSSTTTHDRGSIPGIPLADWTAAIEAGAREVLGGDWERRLAELMAFTRRRLEGKYDIDDFGFDPELTERLLLAMLRPLAEKWFRIEVRGIQNIPEEGGALVVSNHSGTIPVDALMTMVTVHDQTGRFLRPLGADLVFRLPLVAAMARRLGATLACQADAERMLTSGELVGVWPEGFKGIGKPFSERYKLQRFGRGGFVSAALRTGVPIVPLSVVGAEEIYPIVGNLPTLARMLNLPYLPVTPFFPLLGPLGLVPLPSKWLLEFGEPIRTDAFDEAEAEDPMLVFNLTDQVRETIQQTLFSLLLERDSVFG